MKFSLQDILNRFRKTAETEHEKDSLFTLKKPFEEIESSNEFWKLIEGKKAASDFLYRPDKLKAGEGEGGLFKIENVHFKNISFSITEITGFTFRKCVFEGCQFFRTKFLELEFHDCEFKFCNMSKCIIKDTYITPNSFKNCLNKRNHTNVGTHLFQQLMKNAKNADQPDFYKLADFGFMKWKRYEKQYYLRTGKIGKLDGYWHISMNFLYQWVLGYGIRLRHFIASAVLIFVFFWVLNTNMWHDFGLQELCRPCENLPWADSFYYTTISLSNLGYGEIVPATFEGRMWASAQAIIGAIMFAIMASVIFKKFSR